jgi:hypothetical protein
MTAIPWKALPTDPKDPQPITVGYYVQKGQLGNGDSVYVMNDQGTYEQWTFNKEQDTGGGLASADQNGGIVNGSWSRSVTVKDDEDTGETQVSTAPAADCRILNRGGAAWVERESRSMPYFLVGQYFNGDIDIAIGAGTAEAPVSTMITNPNLTAIGVNEIAWGDNPTADDKIQIPTDTSVPLTLRWKKDKTDGKFKWGRTVTDPVTLKSTWRFDYTIPSGTGFWYIRRGGSFDITVPCTNPTFEE